MKKIAISSCFLYNCRYDGKNSKTAEIDEFIEKLTKEGYELVPICPEILGGLSTPRVSAERKNDRVVNKDGVDVTKNFEDGASKVLKIILENGIKLAILKQKSPSCGVGKIYDGTFSKKLILGNGVTTDLLQKEGIVVFSDEEINKINDDIVKIFEI